MTNDDDDQRKEADQLDKQEREPHSHHGTALRQANVHERLHRASSQNTDRREVCNLSACTAEVSASTIAANTE